MSPCLRGGILSLVVSAALAGTLVRADDPAPFRGWTTYGGDAGQRRYSALAQITRANVAQLTVA